MGKTFVPPFKAAFGDTLSYTRWLDDVLPELVWIALLTAHFGPKEGARLGVTLAKTVQGVVKPEKATAFAFLSDYRLVTPESWGSVRHQLGADLEALQTGLAPLLSLYPECPVTGLRSGSTPDGVLQEEWVEYFKPIMEVLLDRTSKQATVVQTTATYIMFVTGVLKVVQTIQIPHLDVIFEYPDTPESRKLASFVRANLNSFVGLSRKDEGSTWPKYFWRTGYRISACDTVATHSGEVRSSIDLTNLASITADYDTRLKAELSEAWSRCALDLAVPLPGEVQAALIARQARFAVALVTEPNLWAYDIGRIILRCMVDTHITLAWLIKKGRTDHYERYVEYGLGQEKLLMEHLNTRLDESSPKASDLKRQIEGMGQWINSQLATWLLPVNVGSWTDKSVRDLAQEADCKDIYALAYAPYSTVVHGSWNAVAKLNLSLCVNPLHKLHRVPNFEDPPLLLDTPIEATRIMDQSIRVWATGMGLEIPHESASSQLSGELRGLIGVS